MYIYCFKCVSLKMKLRLRPMYFRLLAAYLFVCVLYSIRCCLQVLGKIGDYCNYVIIINSRIVAYHNLCQRNRSVRK